MKYNKFTTEDFLKDDFFITSMINSANNDFWEDWIKSTPENLDAYYLANQIIQSIGYKDFKVPKESDYKRVLKNVMAMDQSQQTAHTRPAQKIIAMSPMVKVAAAAALLIMSVWVWRQYSPGIEVSHDEAAIALVSKTAHYGQKTTVRLSDGSKVTLNSGGKITYRKGFSEHRREIELTGEGYFEVAKDPDRPFVVTTGEIATTALGTSFNIRAYGDESNVIISLVTGKVSVGQTEGFDVMLRPGDQLKYCAEGNTVQQKQFEVSNVLAWTKGIIAFDNASMDEVVRELEKWYGVTFEYESHPDTVWNYSGQFENQSLENVLENLSYSQKFQYQRNDKTIKLKF